MYQVDWYHFFCLLRNVDCEKRNTVKYSKSVTDYIFISMKTRLCTVLGNILMTKT